MLADDKLLEMDGGEELLLYGDASLPNRYYYASTRPGLVRRDGVYQLALVGYDKPVDGISGMLSLVIDLEPPDGVLARLKSEHPTWDLQPIPWLAGEVVALLRGGSPLTVIPSLLGSNAAVISMSLTTDQYLLLTNGERKNSDFPLAIVYSLQYEAFRKKFGFSVSFDETKFREWLQKKLTVNLVFINIEKTETFEDLRKSGVIRISSTNETGEEPPEGFKRAFLQSLKAILKPLPHFAAAGDGLEGGPVGFSYSEIRDIQHMSGRLDTSMIVSGPVLRRFNPQGNPAGLAEALKNLTPTILPTGVSFKQQLKLHFTGILPGDPVKAINVEMRPGGDGTENKSWLFEVPGDEDLEIMRSPFVKKAYEHRCTLHFDGAVTQVNSWNSNWYPLERGLSFLDVQPRMFFDYRVFEVSTSPTFPWPLIANIRVELQASTPGVQVLESVYLTEAMATGQIRVFALGQRIPDDLKYVATCRRKDNNTTFDFRGLPAGKSVYLNHLRERTVRFVVPKGTDWSKVDKVAVRPDAPPRTSGVQLWENGVRSFTLNAATPELRGSYWFSGDRKISCQVKVKRKQPPQPMAYPMESSAVTIIIPLSDQLTQVNS